MITEVQASEILKRDIEKQNNFYTVVVDGNTHRLGVCITTRKELITIKKCRGIVDKVQSRFDIDITVINIMMHEFDYSGIKSGGEYLHVLYGDAPLPMLVNKNAYYWPKLNRLQIWSDGSPIYENDNGVICRDLEALADTLL